MEKDWLKVYSSSRLQNVEMLKHLLAERDIEAIILNQQDSFYIVIGEINLFVKRDKAVWARKIISESQL